MAFIPRPSHLRRVSGAVVISGAVVFSAGCGRSTSGDYWNDPGIAGSGNAANGGNGVTHPGAGGASGAVGTAGSPVGGAAGPPSGGTSGNAGTGGSAGTGPLSMGGVKVRLLTQAEYRASLQSLFGEVKAPLELPDDRSVDGFIAIGASKVTVNAAAVEAYEIASRAVVAEVFGDATRWQALVGCQPEANLSDACVETFARAFGKRAFRRDLSDAEHEQWVRIARNAAALAGSAAHGLSALTSGFLQSPNFLYRVETNALDPGNGRLKYDGPSMAVRLAYFLTGGPPSAELLAAGEAGELDTDAGVRAAADPMLKDSAVVERLVAFFYEYTQAELVMKVPKSPVLFPTFDDNMRNSMRESTRLFLEKVVLAPGADVRTFFDSDQTFADEVLAPIYGVTPPGSGFAQFTLAPESGRAGIMGQPAVIAAHSGSDHTSPTRRGLFMLWAFFCTTPEPPPDGSVPTIPVLDPTLTTRQRMEQVRVEPSCGDCHVLFDPFGFALEHFDAIGNYRETENGLPIDTTGTLEDGTPFDDAVGLGKALRDSARVTECLLRNFYRNVNGRTDDLYDQPQIDGMVTSLRSHGYVFRDLVADFITSDAFRSAPAVPLTGDDQ
jgi:hypothetical protein